MSETKKTSEDSFIFKVKKFGNKKGLNYNILRIHHRPIFDVNNPQGLANPSKRKVEISLIEESLEIGIPEDESKLILKCYAFFNTDEKMIGHPIIEYKDETYASDIDNLFVKNLR